MADREKFIKEFEHLLNAAKGNYQDLIDVTVDGGYEILTLLKEQEAVVRCKDCKLQECEGRNGMIVCDITGESHRPDWFCADGEKRDDDA